MKNEAADAPITFEEILMAMICGEKPYLGPLRKQMKREPKRLLVPMVEKAKSSQVSLLTTRLLFHFIIFCNLIVHFVKFFKSFTTERI